jgi:hypothetical protein
VAKPVASAILHSTDLFHQVAEVTLVDWLDARSRRADTVVKFLLAFLSLSHSYSGPNYYA